MAKKVDTSFKLLRSRRKTATEEALLKVFRRMQNDAAARRDGGVRKVVSAKAQRDLADAILAENMLTAAEVAERVADTFGDDEYDPEIMRGWLAANSDAVADSIAGSIEDDITAAGDSDDDEISGDPVGHVFGILASSGAAGYAQQMVTTSAGFGARDAAGSAGAGIKQWVVNSGNPRTSHAAMDGETVRLDENFSNGLAWPGDPQGDADENAGCMCSLTLIY